MKYIATILIIICSPTLPTFYFFWPENPLDTANMAVTINGRTLAKTTVAAEGARIGYHSGDDAALLDSSITRELLFQEAQRLDQIANWLTELRNKVSNTIHNG